MNRKRQVIHVQLLRSYWKAHYLFSYSCSIPSGFLDIKRKNHFRPQSYPLPILKVLNLNMGICGISLIK
jgi:hypothetical protein